jgi:dATP pyrophosphohydrolase
VPEPLAVGLAADEHVASKWVPWTEAAALTFSWSNREAILLLPEKLKINS